MIDQRQLELATTTAARECEPLAAETAELREAWMALSQALSRPMVESDAEAFAAAMSQELAPAPVAQPRTTKPWRLAIAWTATAAAIAAAALLAVGSWFGQPSGSHGEKASQNTVASLSSSPGHTAEDGALWDDSLDTQIADVQDQLAELSSDGPRLDTSLSALDQRLAELADDLNAGSL